MFEMLLDFSGKALTTALVLFLVSRVAERLGPFMASVLMANFATATEGETMRSQKRRTRRLKRAREAPDLSDAEA